MATAGQKLGRYELISQSASDRWLARQPGVEKRVEIRILAGADAQAQLDHAREIAELDHANLIRVVDLGEESGTRYVVTELLDGVTLADAVGATSRFDELGITRVVADAAEGIDAAHEIEGLVHGGVTAAVIGIGFNGHVKVSALDVGDRGALAYTAPERLGGALGDARSDVFSLGVVLWEALTRERLFAAPTDDATRKLIRDMAIESPAMLNANIPAPLADACLKALAADPDARYPSAKQFAVELESVLTQAGYSRRNNLIAEFLGEAFPEKAAARKKKGSGESSGGIAMPVPAASPAVLGAAPPPVQVAPPVLATAPARPSQTLLMTAVRPKTASRPPAMAALPGLPPQDLSKTEAAKAEAARIDAAKAEAVRLDAEKAEALRVETAKAETARAEVAKIEAARMEAARVAAARIETARAEAAKAEAAKAEAAKAEAAKAEAARAEAAKAEAAHLEAAKAEIARAQAAQAEAAKAEAARLEAAKADIARVQAEQAEAAKAEAARLDAAKADIARVQAAQAEAAAAEAAKIEAAKAEAAKAETDAAKPVEAAQVEPAKLEPGAVPALLASPPPAASTESPTKPEKTIPSPADAERRERQLAMSDLETWKLERPTAADVGADAAAAPVAPAPAPVVPRPPTLPPPIATAAAAPAPNPVDAVSLPDRPSTDVIGNWGWSTDSLPTVGEHDHDLHALLDEGDPPPNRKPLLYAFGGAVAVAAIVTIIAMTMGGSHPDDTIKKPVIGKPIEPAPPSPVVAAAILPDAAEPPVAVDPAPAAVAPDAAPPPPDAAEPPPVDAAPVPIDAAPPPIDAAPVPIDAAPPPDAAPPKPPKPPIVVEKPKAPDKPKPPVVAAIDKPKPPKPADKPKTPKTPATNAKPVDPYENPGFDVAAANRSGLQQFARGDTAGALATLRGSLASNPSYAPTWRSLGLIFQKLGERDQARAAFKRYLQLSPNADDAEQVKIRIEQLGA